MAVPTFVAVGTPAGGTGAVSPGLPSGWAADDLHILAVNNKRSESLSTPSGWTLIDNSVPTGDNKITLFKRTAVAGDAAPTVADPGDHCYAVIIGFRNPNGGACAVEATTAANKSQVNTASTAVSWPSITTAGADRMILHALSDGRDATGARFSGETNAALANLAERFDNGITSNDGGGLVLVTGEKAAAGAIGNTTGTLTSATQALLVIAIEAPGGAGSQSITGALFSNANTVYAATVSRGAVSVTGSLYTDADTFYGATLSRGAVSISGALVTDGDTFYGATVSPGAVDIAAELVDDGDQFFAASIVAGGAAQDIAGELVANDNEFFAASVTQPVIRRGWDDAGPRGPLLIYLYEDTPPEPLPSKPKRRRKVTRAAIETAVSLPWAGLWTAEEARQVLPQSVPVTFDTTGVTLDQEIILAIAMWLRDQEDDEDVLMLMTA